MSNSEIASHIVFIVHYFPPINSSGAKRVEALSKFIAREGRRVTIITTRKSAADGKFTEEFPPGVEVLQLDWLGRVGDSIEGTLIHEPMYVGKPSLKRRIKDTIMSWCGQLPDPRLPFAFSFLSPTLDKNVRSVLRSADVVVGSCPPWPMLLAALFVRWRFDVPCVLDYRDHFSDCHEMPGSRLAKRMERAIDRILVRKSDALVTISSPMAKYYSGFRPDVSVIMNGYDHEAMDKARCNQGASRVKAENVVVIRYLGIISPGRVPNNLLAALATLHAKKAINLSAIRFEIYGNGAVLEKKLRQDYVALLPFFIFNESVSYHQALELMTSSDYLLFSETSSKSSLSAQGILTTKLFEYLGSGRPVIADIDPTTLAGEMIKKAGSHHFVADRIEDFERYFQDSDFWNPKTMSDDAFVSTLSRAYQSKQYLSLLDSI